jgi:hypothetical protein
MYDHKTTTTKDSLRNSAHRKMKANKMTRGQAASKKKRQGIRE